MYRRQPGTAWSFSPPASPPPPRDLGSPVLGSDPGVLGGFLALGGGTADPLRALAKNSSSCARCILHRRPSAGVSPCPALWGGPGGRPPRDGCLELNPLRLHYRPQSPEPWLLSRGAQHGEGGERDERDVALSALLPPPAQGAPQEDEEKPPPSLTPPKSIQPRHRGGGGGLPRQVTAGWPAGSPRPRPRPGGAAGWGARGGARAVPPGPGRRRPGAAPCT